MRVGYVLTNRFLQIIWGWAVLGANPASDFDAILSEFDALLSQPRKQEGYSLLTIWARTAHYFFMSFDYARSAKICSPDSQHKLKKHYLISARELTRVNRYLRTNKITRGGYKVQQRSDYMVQKWSLYKVHWSKCLRFVSKRVSL